MRRDEPAPILGPAEAARARLDADWTEEAAAALAWAEFTVPYASSIADEVERWVRAMRRGGLVGRALDELGFPDGQLATRAEPMGEPLRMDAIESVRRKAIALAGQRLAPSVTTADILFALFSIYGTLLDRLLYARGISRASLLDHVAGGRRTTARLELEQAVTAPR